MKHKNASLDEVFIHEARSVFATLLESNPEPQTDCAAAVHTFLLER
jgi:hypothetical protein